MEDTIQKINYFLKEKGYKDRKDIIGILLYGSAYTGLCSQNSDIDVKIITVGDSMKRGAYTVNNKTIEYYETGIDVIEGNLFSSIKEGNKFLLSLFKNSIILYDPYHELEELKEKVISSYQKIKQVKTVPDLDLFIASLSYYEFQRAEKENSIFKNIMYYKALHDVRKIYHTKNGYSSIPNIKVPFLYTDKEKEENYCLHLPKEDYKQIFLKSLREKNEENLEILWEILAEKRLLKEEDYSYKHVAWRTYLSKMQVKEYLSHLYSAKRQVEKIKEIKNEYFSSSLYILLEEIRKFYFNWGVIPFVSLSPYEEYEYIMKKKQIDVSLFKFLYLYNKCLNASSMEQKEKLIQKIMKDASISIHFNPKEYYIKY